MFAVRFKFLTPQMSEMMQYRCFCHKYDEEFSNLQDSSFQNGHLKHYLWHLHFSLRVCQRKTLKQKINFSKQISWEPKRWFQSKKKIYRDKKALGISLHN